MNNCSTVREISGMLRGRLTMNGVPDAPGCARLMMMHALGVDYGTLTLRMNDTVPPETIGQLYQMAQRLEAGEPLQYVLGRWEFCSLSLTTDSRALIPRPETEELAYAALKLARENDLSDICDLGCGTGAIGLMLASQLPNARVTLTDISPDALELTRQNADALGISAEVTEHDMRLPLARRYDLLVSNPPYIPSADIAQLDEQVKDHEPMLALDGGTDGLDFYRALADRFADSLAPGGYLLAEFGIGQAEDIVSIFNKCGAETSVMTDMFGKQRILLAHKSE